MTLFLSGLFAAILCILLIIALKPWLQIYALARPNARSSHKVPTPQGGGIAVIGSALLVIYSVSFFIPVSPWFWWLAASLVIIGIVGMVDDIKPLSPLLRLGLQILMVLCVLTQAGAGFRLFSEAVPYMLEIVILTLGGVWFVNLVNFMDGLDFMSVAETIPLTLFIAGTGAFVLPFEVAVSAAVVAGSMIGFSLFNKPAAKLFLGDVGSLPLGLWLGWMLYQLAGHGYLVAAFLLPLYYLTDASLTLLRRLKAREKVWEAHRSHFYQRAMTNGFSVWGVIASVALLNTVLMGLAGLSMWQSSPLWQAVFLGCGLLATSFVLYRFNEPVALL